VRNFVRVLWFNHSSFILPPKLLTLHTSILCSVLLLEGIVVVAKRVLQSIPVFAHDSRMLLYTTFLSLLGTVHMFNIFRIATHASRQIVPLTSHSLCTRRAMSMKLNTGIVGLPNVGKSTLFNALVGSQAAQAANFPFCTIGELYSIV
jgi:hypothetical protein